MPLLDDIAAGREGVTARINQLSARPLSGNEQRRAQTLDSQRLAQIDSLSSIVSDPNWTGRIDRAVNAQRTASDASLNASAKRNQASIRTDAVRAGRSGGSYEAGMAGQDAQRIAAARATVEQQLGELRAAGIQGTERMGRTLLAQILDGPDESDSFAVGMDQANTGLRASQMQAELDDEFRSLLANQVGSVVSQGITPLVTTGFQAADRYNDSMRDRYEQMRDSGDSLHRTYQDYADAQGGQRSWWGY